MSNTRALATTVLLLLASTPAMGQAVEEVATAVPADEDEPTFLVGLGAAQGVAMVRLTAGDDCYRIELQGATVTTLFTDRPVRQSQSVATAELVSLWNAAFGDDPPNAELQLFDRDGTTHSTVVVVGAAPVWVAETNTLVLPSACIEATSREEAFGERAHFDFGSLFVDSAKIGDWNSCYSGPGSCDSAGTCYVGCLEQWGSFAASCGKIADMHHKRGKRCKHICNEGDCNNGCFSIYDAWTSTKLMASYYRCKE